MVSHREGREERDVNGMRWRYRGRRVWDFIVSFTLMVLVAVVLIASSIIAVRMRKRQTRNSCIESPKRKRVWGKKQLF